jgi:MFS transporter, DHA1 family, tetracycline resistance protein
MSRNDKLKSVPFERRRSAGADKLGRSSVFTARRVASKGRTMSSSEAHAPREGSRRKQHLAIFLTVLIDLIGFGILIPTIQSYAARFGATPWQLTLLMGIYSLMQFIFSPIMGRWSDRLGRRPVLIWSLLVSAVGYLVIAFAGRLPVGPSVALGMIFFARIITGIGGASIGTAQSALADITTPEKRTAVMGMIGAAFGLGFMLGPVLGGLAAHFLGASAPFFIAAGLSIANAIFVITSFPETLPPEKRGASGPQASVLGVWRQSAGTALPGILGTGFLMTTAFSAMTSCFILFTGHHFGFGDKQNGFLFGFIGLLGVIVQGGLIRRIAKPGRERSIAATGMVLMAAAMFLLPHTTPWLTLLLVNALMAIGNSLAVPTISSLASQAATSQDQGLVLGAMQGANSLGRFAGTIIAGPLLYVWPEHFGAAAFSAAGVMMLLALIGLQRSRATATGAGR